ncbi:MAG TPA: chromosome segregation SMC family protein [Candidatus Sulfopaludibacter sp.]|nr:chromosome segregation SMC family protein [Candidatus Sulfopaludibacter sp.]
MVYIKKLEIFGFKSFGSKNIILNLQKGLIVVTGPNGSGKSNILDAILFALGENSPKALRVDRFQSLFHDNLTNTNNNINKTVRVSLTFDNTDRGIPVDKDNVTITREMSGTNSGESQYNVNGKRVSRNNIMELLEIVVASPNKLNIVQQGMITRISELNSEERRKIIEDIIGLSYFDEKKNQAMKQLEESDRRLEIALSKMDDIKNRIDELELERNDQQRFIHLEHEIKRLKAIKISGNLKKIIKEIIDLTSRNNVKENNVKIISSEIDKLNQQIEQINKEKEQFLILSNESNKEKKEMEIRLSSVVYKYERTNAIIKESQYYLNQTDQKEKNNSIEQQMQYQKLKEYEEQSSLIKNKIDFETKNLEEIEKNLEEIEEEIERRNGLILSEINRKNSLEIRLKKLIQIKGEFEVEIVRNEEKIKNLSDKIRGNDRLIVELSIERKGNEKKISDLNLDIKNVHTNVTDLNNDIYKIDTKYTNLSRELEISKKTIDNAEKTILKYDEKMKLAKNILTEDYAIATLLKDFKNLDIIGYVFNLLKWNEKYQKAIIASGNEWMKSIVVKDIKSMVILAEYSKNNGIPFLKIIPIELLDGGKIKKIPNDPSILGVLSEFVYCEINNLAEFLFGNTILTKNPITAYILSKNGYKAVSITGEIFFPNLSLMQFDYGSKISDLTKDILLSDSIEGLKINMEKLKMITKIKISELDNLNEEKIKNKNLLNSNNLLISEWNKKIIEFQNKIDKQNQDNEKIIVGNIENSKIIDKITNILYRYRSRFLIIERAINKIKNEIDEIEKENDIEEINNLNLEKNKISKDLEIKNKQLRQLTLNQSLLKNNFDNINIQYHKSIDEKKIIKKEKEMKETILEKSKRELSEIELELKTLREKENNVIQSTSSAYTKLQEYERTYRKLIEIEKKTSKELNVLEKEIAITSKDILDLQTQRTNRINELQELGYTETLESYDIESIYQDLIIEYNSTREKINLRADETYLEIIDGYRGMSDKKNQLEEERNSIVRFIEETGKEKEIVFTNAFKKVDEDIRKTFSEITGGSAWLDLEDSENIFSGGILLMVQFPGKQARESTALSGGEKTMAAIVFLLALQSLKPSPFYLMDEVDAHLDAQNTERLSKILLLRSGNNQIIMVTLKDSTVAKSDLIFGVYPKNGISQVVKYNHPSKVKITKQN